SKVSQKEARALKRQYDSTFISIWKDLARKDGPKIYRLLSQAQQAKVLNLKKTASLAMREAKKWQYKTNKNIKDLQAKARRSVREMSNFWKRYEKQEKEQKKRFEKLAVEQNKRQEELREAKRQTRKLNFLLTQTELYSHFIGRKIKTDEIEGSSSDTQISALQAAAKEKHKNVEIPTNAIRTDISKIDFDKEDDDALTKAAAANAQSALMDAQNRAKQFNNADVKGINIDDEEMNFQNPTSFGDIIIPQPKMLTCTLKEYQVKGLNWLANLYERGINGILADEMGLGKTVQSISVLSYLAETHNIWGPFLVVSPASTLHNWQQEISRFVPNFKVIPYWGNAKDRKVLRKFWDRKNVVYTKDSPFHVLITSYQLVVGDAQYFQRIKWQYMILDEAQAIKSSQSSRWKVLLGFQCRNRLLLTGTPIQNSMQELWALLHFIMPSLFDSHDEFSEWFSKDIENHAQTNSKLNEKQLQRLHLILKPFMLRRVKKNVQSELNDKIEIDITCELTNRQKKLYQMLKSQISIQDILDKLKSNNDDGRQSLMNLVMQFRKVCNHPDLFERADVKSAFSFADFAQTGSVRKASTSGDSAYTEFFYSTRNPINYHLPKLIYRDLISPSFNNHIKSTEKTVSQLFNIWDPQYIREREERDRKSFGWLKFIDTSPQEASKVSNLGIFERAVQRRQYKDIDESLQRFLSTYDQDKPALDNILRKRMLLIYKTPNNDFSNTIAARKGLCSIIQNVYQKMYIEILEPAARSSAVAPPINVICSDRSFTTEKDYVLFNGFIRNSLMDLSLDNQYSLLSKRVPLELWPKTGMLPTPIVRKAGFSTISMPSMHRFVTDSGKLSRLDELLVELKENDHRVLLYFQMTRMMDLMEEYLTYRQYTYIRLDGSSKLDDRRDLVNDWQTKPEIFVFLLSTRAGGLGINLTAADTVIFYDSDWNPTIDSQAMDRAHRLGQTRQVTVYRLLVRGTIEERMRDRAKQKEHVQQVVMEGKSTSGQKSVDFQHNSKEVASWLLDDNSV
ncbi:chromatin-remodeling ATPase INO80 ASCRUDRAFT_34195, partial [Ascoidea rubescens DSM 1968]